MSRRAQLDRLLDEIDRLLKKIDETDQNIYPATVTGLTTQVQSLLQQAQVLRDGLAQQVEEPYQQLATAQYQRVRQNRN